MEFTSNSDVEKWLVQLNQLHDSQECKAPQFIKPFHFATIVHKLRLAGVNNFNVPDKMSSYANAMNLWGALGIDPPSDINRDKSAGRYYPLDVLRDRTKIEDTAYALVEIFKPVCDDDATIDAVATMLRELVDNCYSHSEVKDGIFGVVCAQVWARGNKAQVAIADTGIGIRASLNENLLLSERLSNSNSCEFATEYGVTSKPGRGHGGYGLAVARKLIEQNNGVLLVRSGYEGFSLNMNTLKKFDTEIHWDGTLLVIEWDIQNPMNIGAVYGSFPLPEGMSDDDFNF